MNPSKTDRYIEFVTACFAKVQQGSKHEAAQSAYIEEYVAAVEAKVMELSQTLKFTSEKFRWDQEALPEIPALLLEPSSSPRR